ncbi:unnamed protein product [Oreochromis niloticus]|nr:unnamed protein product [Mustela putorius furo]
MLDKEVPLMAEGSGESQRITVTQTQRTKWSADEIQAVEKTLNAYIRAGKVPGKAQCVECIEASSVALKDRTLKAVKFYVKNRIDSLKRISQKKK